MTSLEALGELAREASERHVCSAQGSYIGRRSGTTGALLCKTCDYEWPCPDRVFADAVILFVEQQTTRDKQILTFTRQIEACAVPHTRVPGVRLSLIHEDAKAILSLLGVEQDAPTKEHDHE